MIRAMVFLAAMAAALPAAAQSYPSQPVKIIVAFPPGGGADVSARILAAQLAEGIGQTVVVENLAGAGGTIGTARAAQAAPDGYTLMVGTPSTHGTNVAVYTKLSYDPVRDFAPVALLGSSPLMLLTNPAFPAASVRDLVTLARTKPGEINYASYGNGSINHLAGELFSSLADIKVTHVPYKGGAPAIADLLGGRVQYTFDGTASLGQVKSGKLKLLAVTSARRWGTFPEVPTVAESGVPGFDAITRYGLFAPAGTPKPVLDYLNAKVNAALASPGAKDGFAKISLDVVGGAPEVLAQQVRNEIAKWVKVARERNIRISD